MPHPDDLDSSLCPPMRTLTRPPLVAAELARNVAWLVVEARSPAWSARRSRDPAPPRSGSSCRPCTGYALLSTSSLAGQRGGHHAAGEAELHPLPHAVGTARPAGCRAARPRSRARHLRRVAGEEVVHRLLLGQPVAVEVELAGLRIADHILQDVAEGAGGGIDLRLPLRAEADHLGVAPALDVEHPGVAPAVLVVADQRPVGGRRERRLAGAGEAEEEGHVVLGRAVTGAAVQRQHRLV